MTTTEAPTTSTADAALLSVKEVAARYAVSLPTVLRWIDSGELEALDVSRMGSGSQPRWRIAREALERFEANRSQRKTHGEAAPQATATQAAADRVQPGSRAGRSGKAN